MDNDRLKTGSALVILRMLEANNFNIIYEKQKFIERKYYFFWWLQYLMSIIKVWLPMRIL